MCSYGRMQSEHFLSQITKEFEQQADKQRARGDLLRIQKVRCLVSFAQLGKSQHAADHERKKNIIYDL